MYNHLKWDSIGNLMSDNSLEISSEKYTMYVIIMESHRNPTDQLHVKFHMKFHPKSRWKMALQSPGPAIPESQ